MINELDPELLDDIENCINGRQDFRIGGRGICINVIYLEAAKTYVATVPRAFVEIHASDVRLGREAASLTFYDRGLPIAVIDLLEYTKVTKI